MGLPNKRPDLVKSQHSFVKVQIGFLHLLPENRIVGMRDLLIDFNPAICSEVWFGFATADVN